MNTNSINITQNANVYNNNLGNSQSNSLSAPAPDPSFLARFIISYFNFQNLSFTVISTDRVEIDAPTGDSSQVFNLNIIPSSPLADNLTINIESQLFSGYYLGRSDQGNPNSPVVLIQSSTGTGSNIEWLLPPTDLSTGTPVRIFDPSTRSLIMPVNGNFTQGQLLQLMPQSSSTQLLVFSNPES